MNAYLICFEISSKDIKESFLEGVKSYGFYCPINETSWAVKTAKSASEIRDYLGPMLGATDRIFVLRSGTEAAWKNSYGTKHDDWLKENL